MSVKDMLKAHMKKGKGAHPDPAVKNMRAGGKTNKEMKQYGRNMAKVMNQRSPVRKSSGPR